MTAAELQDHRERVRAELGAGTRHVLGVLRAPEPFMRSAPVGDVLCWTDGLDEEHVARILAAAEIGWGRRLSALRKGDVATLCFQIKTRHADVWESWRHQLGEAA